jgi:hypothetical protein
MPHAFSQNEHPFGQCEHFTQVEPFEKPWFLIVLLEVSIWSWSHLISIFFIQSIFFIPLHVYKLFKMQSFMD